MIARLLHGVGGCAEHRTTVLAGRAHELTGLRPGLETPRRGQAVPAPLSGEVGDGDLDTAVGLHLQPGQGALLGEGLLMVGHARCRTGVNMRYMPLPTSRLPQLLKSQIGWRHCNAVRRSTRPQGDPWREHCLADHAMRKIGRAENVTRSEQRG